MKALEGRSPSRYTTMVGQGHPRWQRHNKEYAPYELAYLVAAHGFDVYVTTYDVYNYPSITELNNKFDKLNIQILQQKHHDTICIIAKKIQNATLPSRVEPIYARSFADTLTQNEQASIKKRISWNINKLNAFTFNNIYTS